MPISINSPKTGFIFWTIILSCIVFTWSDVVFDSRVIPKWIAAGIIAIIRVREKSGLVIIKFNN